MPKGDLVPLDALLTCYRPGSYPVPWGWDDEERSLHARVCVCCGQPGHYQQQLEAHIAEHGIPGSVCLGTDGRVWDGHHRIVAARRLGITHIAVEPDMDHHRHRLHRGHPR